MGCSKKNIARILTAIVPRLVLVAIRIPYIYLLLRGHSRRSARGFTIDANSEPIPWWTYSSIDYFSTIDFSNLRVFEYGCGSSTLWWAKRAKFVAGVEMDRDWYRTVSDANLKNVDIRRCEDGGLYPGIIHQFEHPFDVVVIDGAERFKSAQNAIEKVDSRGIIVLDNSEWYPNTVTLLRSNGYHQIDFFGFGPINSFPSVTTLFFHKDTQIFKLKKNSALKVVGGNRLIGGALDDGQ